MNTQAIQHTLKVALTTVSLTATAFLIPHAAHAQETPDLAQSINAHESISTEEATINHGHIDIGPRLIDGEWKVMARHDRPEGAIWYDVNNIVIHLPDASLIAAPDEDAYDFMSAAEQWYVIPQTENPHLPWLGWNTQDPEVTQTITRGVTMTLGSVEGEGTSMLFLQDGTFGPPQILMDGRDNKPHDIWIDTNTHVHANWAFSAPGIYRVPVTFTAQIANSQILTQSATLRFAVGEETSPLDALTTPPVHIEKMTSLHSQSTPADSDETTDKTPLTTYLTYGVAALVFAAGATFLLINTRTSAKQARQAQNEAQTQYPSTHTTTEA